MAGSNRVSFLDRVIRKAAASAMRHENRGYCLECGASRGGCEPDARDYKCEECGAFKVFGAEEILLEFAF